MAIYYNVAGRLARRGIDNAHQLAVQAGLSDPVARRVWANDPVERIDVRTLYVLAGFFGVANPLALLEHREGR